jgi:hypothetical protein
MPDRELGAMGWADLFIAVALALALAAELAWS